LEVRRFGLPVVSLSIGKFTEVEKSNAWFSIEFFSSSIRSMLGKAIRKSLNSTLWMNIFMMFFDFRMIVGNREEAVFIQSQINFRT